MGNWILLTNADISDIAVPISSPLFFPGYAEFTPRSDGFVKYRALGIDTLVVLRPVWCGLVAKSDFSRKLRLVGSVHVSVWQTQGPARLLSFYVEQDGARQTVAQWAAQGTELLRQEYEACLASLTDQMANRLNLSPHLSAGTDK